MKLKQKLQREREQLKNATAMQKLEFFWDYYRWPVITVVLVLVIIGSFVYSAVTSKEALLSGVCLNCYQSSFETSFSELTEGFLTEQDADQAKYTLELNPSMIFEPEKADALELSYQSLQRIGAQVTAGGLDFVIGNLNAMREFAAAGTFYDLSEVLSGEELERLSPYVLEEESGGSMLLDVSRCEKLMESYPYLTEPLVLGIAVNAPNEETVIRWIRYLLDD